MQIILFLGGALLQKHVSPTPVVVVMASRYVQMKRFHKLVMGPQMSKLPPVMGVAYAIMARMWRALRLGTAPILMG